MVPEIEAGLDKHKASSFTTVQSLQILKVFGVLFIYLFLGGTSPLVLGVIITALKFLGMSYSFDA